MQVAGRGEGYVSMSIRPKRLIRDKKRIRNRAKIKFDANPDISPEVIPDGFTACRDGAPLPVESPSPPDGAQGVSRASTLRWEPDCRSTDFEVFVWPTGDPAPADGVTTDVPELPFPPDLLPGVSYNWRVLPANEFDEVPEDPAGVSTWSFTTGIDPPPAAPAIVNPVRGRCVYDSSISLTWTATVRATSYVVFVSPGAGEAPTLRVASPTSETSVEVSPNLLQFGSDPYRWFVVALNADYPTSDVGTPSAERSFRLCLPERATGLAPDNPWHILRPRERSSGSASVIRQSVESSDNCHQVHRIEPFSLLEHGFDRATVAEMLHRVFPEYVSRTISTVARSP